MFLKLYFQHYHLYWELALLRFILDPISVTVQVWVHMYDSVFQLLDWMCCCHGVYSLWEELLSCHQGPYLCHEAISPNAVRHLPYLLQHTVKNLSYLYPQVLLLSVWVWVSVATFYTWGPLLADITDEVSSTLPEPREYPTCTNSILATNQRNHLLTPRFHMDHSRANLKPDSKERHFYYWNPVSTSVLQMSKSLCQYA